MQIPGASHYFTKMMWEALRFDETQTTIFRLSDDINEIYILNYFILYQDDVGGLQIRSKEGKWFNVKPLSHSFVINLGDSLKAWSNGRYHSADHRVVCKGWIDRMSIAFFISFPMETEIWAPEELVDKDNPRRYKPFIFSQFRREITTNIDDREKATALERFGGI
ncbi:hypothetical protein SUGI_0852400 [Cryptomeria japonica]|nr:hypothetical protein SUGI_0852400 [Cryptomeria japonica]